MPERFRALSPFEHTGQSAIIDPRGEIIAGPMDGEGILLAEADLAQVRKAKSACDPAGHYSRPDLFELRLKGETVYPRR